MFKLVFDILQMTVDLTSKYNDYSANVFNKIMWVIRQSDGKLCPREQNIGIKPQKKCKNDQTQHK